MSRKFYTMLLGGTLTMMVESVLLMSDTIIAGVFLGHEAVAGITLVSPMYSAVAFFSSLFSLGLPILYSMAMGEFNKKEADKIVGFGFLISVSVGLILFVLVLLLGEAFLGIYHPSAGTMRSAMDYLFWMRFAFLIIPIQTFLSAMVYTDGDERVSTLANTVQGAGNIIASILLCHSMGVRGIGLASFLFNLASIVILSAHFLKKSNSLHPVLFFSFACMKNSVQYGLVDASSYLFIGLLTAVLNHFISTSYGSHFLVIVSAVSLCRNFQLIFDGIGEAVTPILSVYLGEGCLAGVRKIYALAKKTSVTEGAVLTILLILCAPLFPWMLGISDAEISRFAVRGVRILAFGSMPMSLLYLHSAYYLLKKKFRLGLTVSFLRDFVIAAPAALILGKIMGIDGIFTGLTAASFLSYIIVELLLRWRYGKDAPLLLKSEENREALLFELDVDQRSVLRVRDEIGIALDRIGYDKKTVNRVMLIFEELFVKIIETNAGNRIYAECVLQSEEDGVTVITRDSGKHISYADTDSKVRSFRNYAADRIISSFSSNNQHLAAISFNRNVFHVSGRRDEVPRRDTVPGTSSRPEERWIL